MKNHKEILQRKVLKDGWKSVSNMIGFENLYKIGFDNSPNSSASMDAVKKHFTPEFRNRLDAVIEFNRLSKDMIRPIVMKFIVEINNLMMDRNIKIVLDNSSMEKLIEEGFDDKMGARPMKRIIAEKIKKPLSKRIVFENLRDIVIDVKHNGTDYQLM